MSRRSARSRAKEKSNEKHDSRPDHRSRGGSGHCRIRGYSIDGLGLLPALQVVAPSRPGVDALVHARSGRFTARSASATRQLAHVLRERLRRQLQPLDHRQIREQLIGQIVDGHSGANGERSRLNDFTRFCGDDLHA